MGFKQEHQARAGGLKGGGGLLGKIGAKLGVEAKDKARKREGLNAGAVLGTPKDNAWARG